MSYQRVLLTIPPHLGWGPSIVGPRTITDGLIAAGVFLQQRTELFMKTQELQLSVAAFLHRRGLKFGTEHHKSIKWRHHKYVHIFVN